MKDSVQFVFTERGKHNVYVIRHHTPPKEIVARTLKMLNCIGHNFGNTRIAHVALAEPAIETTFRRSKHPVQIACMSATGDCFGRRRHLLRGFTVPTKL